MARVRLLDVRRRQWRRRRRPASAHLDVEPQFRGPAGPRCRTHLASPAMVAAAAVSGAITDVRRMLTEEPWRLHWSAGVAAPLLRDNIDTDAIIRADA